MRRAPRGRSWHARTKAHRTARMTTPQPATVGAHRPLPRQQSDAEREIREQRGTSMNRRTFLGLAGSALIGAGLGCDDEPTGPSELHRRGRLTVTPREPGTALFEPGEHELSLGLTREPLLYIPPGLDVSVPRPLVILFHGAGGNFTFWRTAAYPHADRLGFVALVMRSAGSTWDVIRGRWGTDVAATDRALDAVFARCAIDPDRICMAGFSDGASYALSLGLTNGELVRYVIAFSPGLERASASTTKPFVFVAHGTSDGVLPIELTSRLIVPRLRDRGYDVTYIEFEGGHILRADIVQTAFDWFVPLVPVGQAQAPRGGAPGSPA